MSLKPLSHLFGPVLLLLIILWQTYVLFEHGWSLFQNVNLIFHEAGHTLFLWAPRFVMVLMGSGFEILLPLVITIYFYRRRQYLGAQFSLWWTGTALWSTGIYAADALERNLPLIGNIDKVYHDWYYLLLETKLLYSAETIGSNIYFLGTIVIFCSIGWMIYGIREQYYQV